MAQVASSNLLQIMSNVDLDNEAAVDENATISSEIDLMADPMDPTLADTESIMKRYEQEDAEKELNANKMKIGDDPKGGIDRISAAQISHNSEQDNEHLRKIFRKYATTVRESDGAPSGEKKLEKWGAMLASEEAIRGWNELSEPALEKFMKDNFEKSWGKYDMYSRGSIDLGESVYFIRDLMMSLAPPEQEEKNPYDVPDVKTIKAEPTATPTTPDSTKKAAVSTETAEKAEKSESEKSESDKQKQIDAAIAEKKAQEKKMKAAAAIENAKKEIKEAKEAKKDAETKKAAATT